MFSRRVFTLLTCFQSFLSHKSLGNPGIMITSVKIYNSDTRSWPENWWSSQETFEDNIFTIILDNESRDEISLLFQDGFWEVVLVN